jgi:hypothetical protein
MWTVVSSTTLAYYRLQLRLNNKASGTVPFMWLRFVEDVYLSRWDVIGGLITLVDMSVVAL